jgi:hypothetical protein
MISDNIRQARMQSLMCNYIVPVADSDLACFAGVVMPHADLCVFLIWNITSQRTKVQRWWQQNRWQRIEELNPHLDWPCQDSAQGGANSWTKTINEQLHRQLAGMSDQDVMALCEIFWPEEHDQSVA